MKINVSTARRPSKLFVQQINIDGASFRDLLNHYHCINDMIVKLQKMGKKIPNPDDLIFLKKLRKKLRSSFKQATVKLV